MKKTERRRHRRAVGRRGQRQDRRSPLRGFDVVARYQGGHNAGHTVKFADKHFALRLIPSGILHPTSSAFSATAWSSIPRRCSRRSRSCARSAWSSSENLKISDSAHCILPLSPALDLAREEAAGEAKIGTTGRGIGPAYETKVGRYGIRVADLLDPERAAREDRVRLRRAQRRPRSASTSKDTFDPAKLYDDYLASARFSRPHHERRGR
jgi:adenylosuccinate synthase